MSTAKQQAKHTLSGPFGCGCHLGRYPNGAVDSGILIRCPLHVQAPALVQALRYGIHRIEVRIDEAYAQHTRQRGQDSSCDCDSCQSDRAFLEEARRVLRDAGVEGI